MSEAFDPYRSWLGISPHERPANHYRLLGVSLFEDEPAVIAGAADRQMAHVRSFTSGPRAGYTQVLLNELSTAKLCLLDPGRKAGYDASLRQQFAQFAPQPAAAPPPPTSLSAPPAPPPPPPPGPAAPAFSFGVASTPAVAPSRPAVSPPREAQGGDSSGSSGTWMLVAAALLLLFLIGGFTVVVIVLQNRPPAVAAPNDPTPLPRPKPVQETVDEPLVVRQEGDGGLNLSAVSAGLFGPQVELVEKETEAWLAGFSSPEDRAEWRVNVAKPGFFRIEVTYAADAAAAGGEWKLACDKQEKRVTIRDTGGKATFTTELVGFIALPRSGRQTITFEPVKLNGGQFLMLGKIRLTPRAPAP